MQSTVHLDKMHLNQLIKEFRQLQTVRKTVKNEVKNQKIRKMAFRARVRMEEGLPVFWANINFFQGVAINIAESTTPHMSQRRQLTIMQDEVETYNRDYDSVEINFRNYVNKPNPLIILKNFEEAENFEIAFRCFMEYSNPEKTTFTTKNK